MFHGISHVDLQALNLDQSRQFWNDIIGFSINIKIGYKEVLLISIFLSHNMRHPLKIA